MKEMILSLILGSCPGAGDAQCPEVEFDGLTGATVAEHRVHQPSGKEVVVVDVAAIKRANLSRRQVAQGISELVKN